MSNLVNHFHRHRAILRDDLTPEEREALTKQLIRLGYELFEREHKHFLKKERARFTGKRPDYILFFPYFNLLLERHQFYLKYTDKPFMKFMYANTDFLFYLSRSWDTGDAHIHTAFISKRLPEHICKDFNFTDDDKALYPFFEDSYADRPLHSRSPWDIFRPIRRYNNDVLIPVTFEDIKPFLPYLHHEFHQEPNALPNPSQIPGL